MTRKHAVRAFWLGAACAVAALGLAVAAGAGGKATPQPKNGGTLVIGLAEEPDALDPTLARTFVGRIVFLHMCEKLYDLDAKLHIVPQLAAALPQVSKDKLTYTIKLRSGVKFNDGTPFNAAAVKASLERTGFKRVRLEQFGGGHQLKLSEVRRALQWFRQLGRF